MDLHILYDSEQKICLSYGDKNSIDIKYSSLCNEFSKNGLETINLKKINLKEFLKKYECNDLKHLYVLNVDAQKHSTLIHIMKFLMEKLNIHWYVKNVASK